MMLNLSKTRMMATSTTRSLLSICVMLIGSMLITCGKDSPTKPQPLEPPAPVIPAPSRIVVTPSSAILNALGRTVLLTATVYDQNNVNISEATVTWSSSNINVATVNGRGLVTAVKNGTTRITARSGNASSSIEVTVAQRPETIVIEPSTATLMAIGDTVQLTATALDQNGQAVSGAVVTWSSSDEGVATVDDQGLVTAVKNGIVQISASSGSVSAGIDVRIMQVAGSVVIEPLSVTPLLVGETLQLTATVLDQNGQAVSGAVVTWSSSDEGVAAVDDQGLVTAVKNGDAEIAARSGNTSASISLTVKAMDSAEDREVLTMLYQATDGPNWNNSTNWLSDEFLDNWHGVTTDGNGRVTELNLGNNNLQGLLPSALSKMTSLIGLALDGNRLTDAIPAEFGQLVNLTHLYLSNNQLTGPIPSELGKLSRLVHLCLDRNRLTGDIPAELGQLSNLRWLHLHNNLNLTGPLPHALTDLTLEILLLEGTQLCAPIDNEFQTWLGGITDVRVSACAEALTDRDILVALYNATDGDNWAVNTNWLGEAPLRTWHGVRTDTEGRVVNLNLGDNKLEGTMPGELGQLANLKELYLYSNNLAGVIPPEFGLLSKLRVLDLGRNRLTGDIPRELGQLNSIEIMLLFENQLSGALPSELKNLTRLKTLWLYSNRLTGSIPAELGQIPTLEQLNLDQNLMTGSIPAELVQLTNLYYLSLRYNRLTGNIPVELGQMRNLKTLTLSHNKLNGTIPAELGQLANLDALWLEHNKLTGEVPAELGLLTNLRGFLINDNPDLAGPLPLELTNIPGLEILDLDGTELCVPNSADFQVWLKTLRWTNITFCETAPGDSTALTALYKATGGPQWHNNENWLSEKPLKQWAGISTNDRGRVDKVVLGDNNLQGNVPPELGHLADLRTLILHGNSGLSGPLPGQFTGLALDTLYLDGTRLCAPSDDYFQAWLRNISERTVTKCNAASTDREILVSLYNSTDGENWQENTNWLSDQPVDEWFGVSSENGHVSSLVLRRNELNGTIPPELGQLTRLTRLDLAQNKLTGRIPPELGRLNDIRNLGLSGNKLNGGIPPELGKLHRLLGLWLNDNRITGQIPPELGRLERIQILDLGNNRLTGSIPAELGQLDNLKNLHLFENQLTGSIPLDIGKLINLGAMRLEHNRLTGSIPVEIGNLTNLRTLNLSYNSELSGPIPESLIKLRLNNLRLSGTKLCAPQDSEFMEWLESIPITSVSNCFRYSKSTAYLTQAVQSLEHPVPLVAGRPALLRVFYAGEGMIDNKPAVNATFFQNSVEVYSVLISSDGGKIPVRVDESSLENSANAVIPASILKPGLEMVVEIDPYGTAGSFTNTGARIPEIGRMPLNVQDLPLFDLTMVPLLWAENPDHSVVTETNGLTYTDELFRPIRTFLPIQDFDLSVREPIYVSVDPVLSNLHEVIKATTAIRALDGATGYYIGVLRDGGGASASAGVTVSHLDGSIMAHELGHNMSLMHAPCGGADWVDPAFPREDGSIGAWGYDFFTNMLIHPATSDLMTYCRPWWISPYHFTKALNYRINNEENRLTRARSTPQTSLLLWGGVDEDGRLLLEPAFAIDARPVLPQRNGPYMLRGNDEYGRVLFNISFDMDDITDSEGAVFAFTVPMRTDWMSKLRFITLTGPAGKVTIDDRGEQAAALLLDSSSGMVKGILNDWIDPPLSQGTSGRITPVPGVEVVISRGIPEPVSQAP